MNLTPKTGDMAALLLVHPDEDLMIITDEGTIIRSAVDSIRLCGRYTQGVKLMRLNEGAQIIGVARADREETADADETTAPDPNEPDGGELDMVIPEEIPTENPDGDTVI